MGRLVEDVFEAPPVCGEDVVFRSISFGYVRVDPRTGRRHVHEGIDLFAPEGSEIHAPVTGVIDRVGSEKDRKPGGNRIRLKSARTGAYVYMAHMLFPPLWTPGDRVRGGDLVNWVGRSGAAWDTAAHVHLELLDAWGRKVNPYSAILRSVQGADQTAIEFRGTIPCPTIEEVVAAR